MPLLWTATTPTEIALKIGGWVGLCQAFNGCSFAADFCGLAGLRKCSWWIVEKQGLSNRIITDSFGCLKIN